MKFKNLKKDTEDFLKEKSFYDIGDVGNEIGYILAKFLKNKDGWSKEDFIDGIKHGISLVDGTH